MKAYRQWICFFLVYITDKLQLQKNAWMNKVHHRAYKKSLTPSVVQVGGLMDPLEFLLCYDILKI